MNSSGLSTSSEAKVYSVRTQRANSSWVATTVPFSSAICARVARNLQCERISLSPAARSKRLDVVLNGVSHPGQSSPIGVRRKAVPCCVRYVRFGRGDDCVADAHRFVEDDVGDLQFTACSYEADECLRPRRRFELVACPLVEAERLLDGSHELGHEELCRTRREAPAYCHAEHQPTVEVTVQAREIGQHALQEAIRRSSPERYGRLSRSMVYPRARCATGAHLLRFLVKIGALIVTAPGASSVSAHTRASSRSGESDAPGTHVQS